MKGGHYTAEGLEHNEKGNPNYTPEMHEAMTDKRWRKVNTARQQLALWSNVVEEWGDEDAAIAIMGWGSSSGPIQEAMARAQAAGYKVAALFPKVLFPMPEMRIRRFMRGRRAIIIPELNHLGQFARVVQHRYSHELIPDNVEVISVTKYQGLPFRPVEIYEKIVEVSQALAMRVPSTQAGWYTQRTRIFREKHATCWFHNSENSGAGIIELTLGLKRFLKNM